MMLSMVTVIGKGKKPQTFGKKTLELSGRVAKENITEPLGRWP